MRRGSTFVFTIVWAVVWAGSLAGCQGTLPRLVERGRYDEAIARAESGNRLPRGAGARAYAKALTMRGRTEEARSVLLRDYRQGGRVPSLLALADLEYELGLRGTAAAHYSRVHALDDRALRGRADVCGLWLERAERLLALGDALAAEADLLRTKAACPRAEGAAAEAARTELATRIDRAADLQAKDRVAKSECSTPGCKPPPDRGDAVLEALRTARAGGPAALADASRRWGASLEPEATIELLRADLRAALQSDVLLDDDVRRFVGGRPWSDFSGLVNALPPPEAGYVQLRLAAVMPDLPLPPGLGQGAGQLERWADRALDVAGEDAWRVHAWRGDLPTAELALSSRLKPPRAEPLGSGTPAAPLGADGSEHWAARVAPTDATLAPLLRVARLRQAAQRAAVALQIRRAVLRRAHEAKLATTLEQARSEVLQSLALGRPWEALATLDAVPLAELDPLRAAAADAIEMQRLFCDGTCPEDDDFDVASMVMGEPWVEEVLRRAPEWALAHGHASITVRGCPALDELLAEDATGPLAEALDRARGVDEPGRALGLAKALAHAIEADPALACAGRYALVLMAEGNFKLEAERVSDLLAHVPEIVAGPQLQVQAELAVIAGQRARAELFGKAAGAVSVDPVATWRDIATTAHTVEAFAVERYALHRMALQRPGLAGEDVGRALMLDVLRTRTGKGVPRRSAVGRETVAKQLVAYLGEVPPALRWSRTDALLHAVAEADWYAVEQAPEIFEAFGGAAIVEANHPVAAARLGGKPVPTRVLPFDVAALAQAVRSRALTELPAATIAFASASELEPVRLALSEHARDFEVRRRMAVGLAVVGSERARAVGVATLLAMAPKGQRSALSEWVLQRPAALAPADRTVQPVAVIEDPRVVLRLVYGLDLSPAFVAR